MNRIIHVRERAVEAMSQFLYYVYCLLLITTVIERTPRNQMKYKLEMFWTVGDSIDGRRELISEIFWNIVLFVLMGVLTFSPLSNCDKFAKPLANRNLTRYNCAMICLTVKQKGGVHANFRKR